eukprot:284817471_4
MSRIRNINTWLISRLRRVSIVSGGDLHGDRTLARWCVNGQKKNIETFGGRLVDSGARSLSCVFMSSPVSLETRLESHRRNSNNLNLNKNSLLCVIGISGLFPVGFLEASLRGHHDTSDVSGNSKARVCVRGGGAEIFGFAYSDTIFSDLPSGPWRFLGVFTFPHGSCLHHRRVSVRGAGSPARFGFLEERLHKCQQVFQQIIGRQRRRRSSSRRCINVFIGGGKQSGAGAARAFATIFSRFTNLWSIAHALPSTSCACAVRIHHPVRHPSTTRCGRLLVARIRS